MLKQLYWFIAKNGAKCSRIASGFDSQPIKSIKEELTLRCAGGKIPHVVAIGNKKPQQRRWGF